MDLVADVGVGLVLDCEVFWVVLLDKLQIGQARNNIRPLLFEVFVQAGLGGGGHDPFRSYIVEVLEDGVDTHLSAWPAEAMHQPGGHCSGSCGGQLRGAISERVEEVGRGAAGDVRVRVNRVSMSMENCFLTQPQLSSRT